VGFWFWPHLRYLAGGQLSKPFARVLRDRRLPVGVRVMMVACHARIGKAWLLLLAKIDPDEHVMGAIAIANDRID
jgi:hypothetical protein